MSAKHTPGPWAFGSFGNLLVIPVIDGQPCKYGPICDLGPQHFPSDTEAYANASLIATAPELLSELQAAHQIIKNALSVMTPKQKLAWAAKNEVDGVIGEGDTRANERLAVINKATGEPQ